MIAAIMTAGPQVITLYGRDAVVVPLGSESHFRKITIKARSKRMKAACEWSVFRG